MAVINCPKCGKETTDANKFCFHCGYSLETPSPAPMFPSQVEQIHFRRTNYRRLPILAVIVLLMSLAVYLFVSALGTTTFYDPFEKLYIGQTRENVHELYGTPDHTVELSPIWNCDFFNVPFLGKTGELKIEYDNDNLVSYAHFTLNYHVNYEDPEADPSAKPYLEAIGDGLTIMGYYNTKYGLRKYGDDWHRVDGSGIGFKSSSTYDFSDPDKLLFYWIRIILREQE